MVTFADRVTRWQPPKSGKSHFNHMVHGLHNLKAEHVLSRFDTALLHIAQHQRKRSLVVMITHVLDLSSAKRLHQHIQAIGHRHLPLIILIKDPDVEAMLPDAKEQFDHPRMWPWSATRKPALHRCPRTPANRRETAPRRQPSWSNQPPKRSIAQVVSEYLRPVKANAFIVAFEIKNVFASSTPENQYPRRNISPQITQINFRGLVREYLL